MSTLNENILKVKETFQNIAAAIEEKGVDVGECDSPVTYADKIRSISGSAESGFDIDKLYVEAYETNAPEPSASVSPTEDGGVMITFGLRRGETGPQGPQGPQGPAGKDGESGTDGKDGVDGSTYEYVYFRGLTLEDKPIDIPSGEGNNQNDYKPTYTKTVTVDGIPVVLKWTDRAQGVDETYKFEWRSERKKKNTTTWEDFTSPILWAKYGEKGKDGDGVQYIFTTTKTSKAPSNPSPTNWETDPLYQNNEIEEYFPAPEDGQIWEDDPIEVDDVNQFCWVSVRKYRNGKWGRYSDPTLWTKWTDSSGTVVSDTIVVDLDPDWAMVNKDLPVAKTDITARRGNDPIIIQDVTCNEGDFKFFADKLDKDGITWRVTISEMDLESNIIPVRLHIKLSETQSWTKTFTIYPTSLDNETISADFGDDNILVPCSDGETPDADFFTNLEVPILMRVGGREVTATSATPEKYSDCFELTTSGNLKVKKYPGTNQRESIKFTISDGVNPTTAYLNFTKFNTAGGTISMYTLNINANDIVCDTRSGQNVYTVYTGKQSSTDNVIKASINVYSTNGNTIIPVSELPSKYAVFYANDPQDWVEDASSTIGEYQKITDDGIKIGETIAPDKCVAFQLREWIGNGEPWSDMSETNYKIWDDEIISVDIIRDIAAYKFVLTPNKIHRNVNGEIIVPINKKITVGLSKNKAGDGETKYESLSVIPGGYDIYCEKDNNGNPEKFGGEPENVSLPVEIDVTDVTNSVVLTLVVNERSDDNDQVVLSETIEVTSDVPGETAYVGYLTDSLGVVSCNADGEPTTSYLSTTFKVTNVDSVVLESVSGKGFAASISEDTVTFSNFTKELEETTKVTLTAIYTDENSVAVKKEAVYTIVKLQIAESNTLLDFSNNNVIVPCDENLTPLIDTASVTAMMSHGDTDLEVTTSVEAGDDQLLKSKSQLNNGSLKLTFNTHKIPWEGKDRVEYSITFTGAGTDDEGIEFTKTKTKDVVFIRQINLGGNVWDLVLSDDSPKFNNETDSFDEDYVEGWVNVWGSNDWEVLSYNDMSASNRLIVYKPSELDDSYYEPISEDDFDSNNHFKIYINSQGEDSPVAYVDIDTHKGIDIALAELNSDGSYNLIQIEPVHASYDGRDFSKFELMLSDNTINKMISGENASYSPNEIKILGVFEHEGSDRTKYEGTLHNKHVSGLDLYYSIDGGAEIEIKDISENGTADGWVTNDKIPVNLNDVTDRIDVYLYAYYNKPNDNTDEPVRTLIDHKLVKLVPYTVPKETMNYHLELEEDNITVPLDGNTIDNDWTTVFTPYLLSNDEVVAETFTYCLTNSETTPSSGFGNSGATLELKPNTLKSKPKYIYVYSPTAGLYKRCQLMYSQNAYELTVDKKVVKRDLYENAVLDTINITLKKWNGTDWDVDTTTAVYWNGTDVSGNQIATGGIEVENRSIDFGIKENSDYKYPNLNSIKVYTTPAGYTISEDIGVVTDGMDGSSREVLYCRMTEETAPANPTPEPDPYSKYQKDDFLPSDMGESYTSKYKGTIYSEDWFDNFPGVDSTYKYVYACERRKVRDANSTWGDFSTPALYAEYAEKGESAWSWRLSDPIEMVSYNSDGNLNGTLNSTTTVLANYGGNIANVTVTSVKEINETVGCVIEHNGAIVTLKGLPGGTDVKNFNFIITATGTYTDENDKLHTGTANLTYTVKKWFGEPATVTVHLSNNSTPVITDSNGTYTSDVVRTATLTASSGTNPVNIDGVTCKLSDENISANLNGDQLTITVGKDADWSGEDVLTVPIECTLSGGYPAQTVAMSFYKVRGAKEAEYPSVYDLFVSPNAIFVDVDQNTGMGVYKNTTITPTIRKYNADNTTKDYNVSDFNTLDVGSIYYSFDGNPSWDKLNTDSFDVNNNKKDADEYIDVKLTIKGDSREQIERVKVSHGQIPNIDWELVLDCPERILYDYEGNIKITAPTVACKLCKNVNGTLTNVTECPANFDIVYELDGIRAENDYVLGETVIGLSSFNNTCEFILVNQGDENNEQDEVYDRKLVTKEYDPAPGGKGESSIITQLSNPASIIQLIDGDFSALTASTILQARKGSEFVKIEEVSIKAVRVNGIGKTGDYIPVSINPILDDKNYTDNKLTFTLISDKLVKEEQAIEIDLNITINEKAYVETKTILIQKTGGENAIHLELTNDMDSVTSADIISGAELGISTTATLYDGTTDAKGTDITWGVEWTNCEGSKNENGNPYTVTVNSITDSNSPISVKITATYKGEDYIKIFTIVKSESKYKLVLTPSVINSESPIEITGKLLIDGQFVEEPSGVEINYYINDSTTASGKFTTGSFTINADTVKTITKNIRFDVHAENQIVESETIGIVENGKNAKYGQIDVNHRWIVKDSDGITILEPTEDITPFVWLVDGDTKTKITNATALMANGYQVYASLDGTFNKNALTDLDWTTSVSNMSKINKQLVYYLFPALSKPTSAEGWIDYVEIDVVKNGKSGSTPVIYPAGEFDAEKATKGEYVGNSNQAPYVYYNVESDLKGFYIAYGTPKAAPSNNGNIITKDEEVDWMNIPNDAAKWIVMNNFNAIYSDIGVLQHALVGKWVFHGDYMFSQDGHLGNPESGQFNMVVPGGAKNNGDECSYDLVAKNGIIFYQIPGQETGPKNWPLYQHIKFGSWVPNIWFNAKTGAGRLGDAMTFDEQGVTTILKSPVFKKESVIFEGEPLRMSSLHNNTNYVFSATSKFEFNQHVIIGESSDERFSINEDVVVQFTNNTDVPIDLRFVNIYSWETLHASANDDNELEEYINIVFKQDPLWTLNAPGIEDGGSGFNQRTDTLLLYPGKSIELNIFAEKPGINYIITKTPLWSTIWDGNLVACNIPSFIPYGEIIGTDACKHFDPFSPVVTIQDCNFNMMRFIDNWVDELVLFKIFDSNGDYLSNIVISDKNEWFKVPVPKGGTISIYYSNKDIFSNECAVIARMLFATESMFGGSNYLQYAKGDFNVQEGFEIANKITYTRYNGWYAFDLKIPDTTMKLTVKGVEPYSNHKLFREVTLKFVRSNIKFSFQDPDNFDYDYEDYAAFSVTCIMGDATEGYKRLSYDAPMRKPEDGFWKFNGDFWDVDYRENMDFVLYPNNNSVGSISESVQILLNPRYVMNGLDRNRSIVWIITATLKDGSEKDVKIKLTLNDKSWSSTDKFITLI